MWCPRSLPPAVGAFENPRSRRELISQPPGTPDAVEPVGPTQLRQCGDARRLIPIAIHECEKSRHHRPLPPPQDRRRIHAQPEHNKNITTHPALTGEGGFRKKSGEAGVSLTAWRFKTTSAYSRGVELGAIRISPVVAAYGSFRCCHQGLRRGDAARLHGADLSERVSIVCRSHDQRVHCRLDTQAIPLARRKRNGDTWHVYSARWFLPNV